MANNHIESDGLPFLQAQWNPFIPEPRVACNV
jgi:hypothetical protein